jgi:hypothetical protein
MAYDKIKFQDASLVVAKAEIKLMTAEVSAATVLSELRELYAGLNSYNLVTYELMLYGVRSIADDLVESDLPDIVGFINEIKYPQFGGEERATFFFICKAISDKVSQFTAIAAIGEGGMAPDDLQVYVNKVTQWCDEHLV